MWLLEIKQTIAKHREHRTFLCHVVTPFYINLFPLYKYIKIAEPPQQQHANFMQIS